MWKFIKFSNKCGQWLNWINCLRKRLNKVYKFTVCLTNLLSEHGMFDNVLNVDIQLIRQYFECIK